MRSASARGVRRCGTRRSGDRGAGRRGRSRLRRPARSGRAARLGRRRVPGPPPGSRSRSTPLRRTRPSEVVPQQWAEFFASIPHGRELALGRWSASPRPARSPRLCSTEALGCYNARELVMLGEPYDGVAPEHVARHEYGHHIAANRSNPPWRAADWGPKRWATAAHVCRRSEQHTAFPGDDGTHYRLDPGEAFAESYRVLAEQKAGAALATWGLVDGSFYPDRAALRAIEQDVATPWTHSTTTRTSARFLADGPRRRLVPRRDAARRRAHRRAEAAAVGGSTRSSSSRPTDTCSRAVSGRGRARGGSASSSAASANFRLRVTSSRTSGTLRPDRSPEP